MLVVLPWANRLERDIDLVVQPHGQNSSGNAPDFRTIADFRKLHLAALNGFFEQVLRLARELGAPRMGRVALDGTKVKANASKHKAMSDAASSRKARFRTSSAYKPPS